MKAALIGYGTMGKLIMEELGTECAVCIAPNAPDAMVNLYEYEKNVDIIIDFSNPANWKMINEYARDKKCAVVIGTTGHTEEQLKEIEELSKIVPVLKSKNYSIGSILLNKFVEQVTPLLQDEFDIEVVEVGHAKKIDGPSASSADEIVNILKEATSFNINTARDSRSSRSMNEIGIHQIRGGNEPISHEVLYLGEAESITIKHTELSKTQFASGAVRAATWLLKQEPGLYTMEDVIFKNKTE